MREFCSSTALLCLSLLYCLPFLHFLVTKETWTWSSSPTGLRESSVYFRTADPVQGIVHAEVIKSHSHRSILRHLYRSSSSNKNRYKEVNFGRSRSILHKNCFLFDPHSAVCLSHACLVISSHIICWCLVKFNTSNKLSNNTSSTPKVW